MCSTIQEPTMYKRILVPVDGSEASTKALVAALQLAREATGRVRVLHVLDELAYLSGFEVGADLLDRAREYGARTLQEAMAVAGSSGVPADMKLVESHGPRLGDTVAAEARE